MSSSTSADQKPPAPPPPKPPTPPTAASAGGNDGGTDEETIFQRNIDNHANVTTEEEDVSGGGGPPGHHTDTSDLEDQQAFYDSIRPQTTAHSKRSGGTGRSRSRGSMFPPASASRPQSIGPGVQVVPDSMLSTANANINALRGAARQWTLLALHWRRQSRPEVALRYLSMGLAEAEAFFEKMNYKLKREEDKENKTDGKGEQADHEQELDVDQERTERTVDGDITIAGEKKIEEYTGEEQDQEVLGVGTRRNAASSTLSTRRGGGPPLAPPRSFYPEQGTTDEIGTAASFNSYSLSPPRSSQLHNSSGPPQSRSRGRSQGSSRQGGGQEQAQGGTGTSRGEQKWVINQKQISKHPFHNPRRPAFFNPEPFRASKTVPHPLDIYYENQATPAGLLQHQQGSSSRTGSRRSRPVNFYSDDAAIERAKEENAAAGSRPGSKAGGSRSTSRSGSRQNVNPPQAQHTTSLSGSSLMEVDHRSMSIEKDENYPSISLQEPSSTIPPSGGLPSVDENFSQTIRPHYFQQEDSFLPPPGASAPSGQFFYQQQHTNTIPPGSSGINGAFYNSSSPDKLRSKTAPADTSPVKKPMSGGVFKPRRPTSPGQHFAAAKQIEGTLRMNAAAILSDLSAFEESKEELMEALDCADNILDYCQTKIPTERLDALYNAGVSLKCLLLEALAETAPMVAGLHPINMRSPSRSKAAGAGNQSQLDLQQLYRDQALAVAKALLPEDHPLVAYCEELALRNAYEQRSPVKKSLSGAATTYTSLYSSTNSGGPRAISPDAPKKVKREELECSTMTDPIFDDLRSAGAQSLENVPTVTYGYDLVEMDQLQGNTNLNQSKDKDSGSSADEHTNKAMAGFYSGQPTTPGVQYSVPIPAFADLMEASSVEFLTEEEGGAGGGEGAPAGGSKAPSIRSATTRLSSEIENERMRKTKAMKMEEKGPFYTENPFKDFTDYNLSKKPHYESPNYYKEEGDKLDYLSRNHRSLVNNYDQDELFYYRLQCTAWGHKVRRRRLVELQKLRVSSQGRERIVKEMDKHEGIKPKQIEQDVRMTTTEIRNSMRSMAQVLPSVKTHIQRGDRIKESEKERLIHLMMTTRIRKNASDADYILRMKHMKEPLKKIWMEFVNTRKRETGIHIKFHRVQEDINKVRKAHAGMGKHKPGTQSDSALGSLTKKEKEMEQAKLPGQDLPPPSSFLDYRYRDYRPKGSWAVDFQKTAYAEEEKRRAKEGLPPLEKGAVLRMRNDSK
ncbi:unnamed protein product [Amoebophrya sp. A120]|nr:unnamed protein product [Amoebophrya sp. A120]|eukprot:GSA120T00024546001.1